MYMRVEFEDKKGRRWCEYHTAPDNADRKYAQAWIKSFRHITSAKVIKWDLCRETAL